jgi:hypothetical protein
MGPINRFAAARQISSHLILFLPEKDNRTRVVHLFLPKYHWLLSKHTKIAIYITVIKTICFAKEIQHLGKWLKSEIAIAEPIVLG